MRETSLLIDKYSTTRNVTRERPSLGNDLNTILLLQEGAGHKGQGGLRTQGYFKRTSTGLPLITLVTVVYNGERFLEKTLLSVINQTYANVEYIIIDGGSTDGTLGIISQYAHAIDYWVSEKDNGIYDAMNKGVRLSLGEWICFMNAGDVFYSSTTLDDVFKRDQPRCDVIYGDTVYSYGSFSKGEPAKNLAQFWKGMPFIHQSSFVRTGVQKNAPFRTDLMLAADFDCFYKLYKEKKIFCHKDAFFSVAILGGKSDAKRIASVLECWKVISSHGIRLHQAIYFATRVVIEVVKKAAKVIFPKKIIQMIQKG